MHLLHWLRAAEIFMLVNRGGSRSYRLSPSPMTDLGTIISGFSGERFQDLASVLLGADVKDFQAVNGAGGDGGNDGYSPSQRALYQMYGPPRVTADRVRSKVDSAVMKAADLRRKQKLKIEKIVLVTSFDLTNEQHLYFQRRASRRKLAADSLGRSRMVGLVAAHAATARAFPEFAMLAVHQAINPDPKHIKKVFQQQVYKASIELEVLAFRDHLKTVDVAVRDWLDGTSISRGNFAARVWDVRHSTELVHTLSHELKKEQLSSVVRSTIESVNVMIALHEKHNRDPPRAEQEPLIAVYRERAEAARRGLEELLLSLD